MMRRRLLFVIVILLLLAAFVLWPRYFGTRDIGNDEPVTRPLEVPPRDG